MVALKNYTNNSWHLAIQCTKVLTGKICREMDTLGSNLLGMDPRSHCLAMKEQ